MLSLRGLRGRGRGSRFLRNSLQKSAENPDLPLTGLAFRLSPGPLSGVSAFVSEGAVRPAGKTQRDNPNRPVRHEAWGKAGARVEGNRSGWTRKEAAVRRAKSLAWIGGVGLLGLTPAMGFAQGLPRPPSLDGASPPVQVAPTTQDVVQTGGTDQRNFR